PFELLSTVVRKFGDGRLRRIPVPRAVLIKVGCGTSESAKRVSENGRRFTRHHASKLDASILEATIGGADHRCGSKVRRARDAPRSVVFTEIRDGAIDI